MASSRFTGHHLCPVVRPQLVVRYSHPSRLGKVPDAELAAALNETETVLGWLCGWPGPYPATKPSPFKGPHPLRALTL